MEPRTNLTQVQQQFRRQATAYESMAGVADEKGLAAIVRLTGAGSNDRALDVACGPGFLTAEFAKVCRSAVGADATDVFLEHARRNAERNGLGNVCFVEADAERLPFPDAAFDIAVCRSAFHHFVDPGYVLDEMVRVTGASGRIAVIDMLASEDPDKAAYQHTIERLCDPTHARALSRSQFEALFAVHGLRVVFTGERKIDYRLQDWIAHGGPSGDAAAEIVRLMTASIEVDRNGLDVRRDGEHVVFSYTGAGFLLVKA